MRSETGLPASSTVISPTRPMIWLRGAGIVLCASIFVALCAHVSLPLYFTPVPLTLQPFAVLLIGLLLSPRLAAASLVAYLAEGAVGLPVFTPGPVGMAHLFGPTAGYLLAYPFAAMLISLYYNGSRRGWVAALVSAAAGDLLILCVGALWLATFTHASAAPVLMQSVVPFLPGDALKVIAAASLASAWVRQRGRTSAS